MKLQKHIKEIMITLWVIGATTLTYAAVSTATSWGTLTATMWNDMKTIVDSNETKLGNIYVNGTNVWIGETTPGEELTIKSVAPIIRLNDSDGVTGWAMWASIRLQANGTEHALIWHASSVWILSIANRYGDIYLAADPSWSITTRMVVKDNGEVSVWGSVVHSSDERFKDNIVGIGSSLDKLTSLDGVSYTWKENTKRDDKTHLWVIAQEVESVFPELVSEGSDWYKSVDYNWFIAPIIESFKELKAENEALKQRIENLENK